MTHFEETQRMKLLCQENEQLRARLAITRSEWIQQTFRIEELEKLEETIRQKEEELGHKQKEIEKLQKRMEMMIESSRYVEIPVPVCHICGFEYDKIRVPKVLHCGHTLCFECVKCLDKIWSITCPFCRIEKVYDGPNMPNGALTTPTNFTLVEMMEVLNQQRNAPSAYSDTFLHDIFFAVVAPVTICYIVMKN